jgi:hypothetical protein
MYVVFADLKRTIVTNRKKMKKREKHDSVVFSAPFISFITQARARATQNTHVLR